MNKRANLVLFGEYLRSDGRNSRVFWCWLPSEKSWLWR